MAKPAEAKATGPMPSGITVAELVDRFLDLTHHNRKRPTYEAYKRRLQIL